MGLFFSETVVASATFLQQTIPADAARNSGVNRVKKQVAIGHGFEDCNTKSQIRKIIDYNSAVCRLHLDKILTTLFGGGAR